ncbi:MAG: phosphatase PAP2 family protein [Anaerolineaceae bacterium]|nr:phosphatase PAP2 family protein [Anaerolineaceae bacterium]
MKRIVVLDHQITEKFQIKQKGLLWSVFAFLAHSGDSWFWLVGIGLVWVFGNQPWHDRAAIMGIAVFILAVLVLSLKFTFKRKRPESEWGKIYRNTDPHSFPSGHAARAFLLAVLALGLGPEWFGLLLIIWAPLVCLARILMGVHYFSDVLGGIIIGSLFGVLMLWVNPLLMRLLPFLY